MLFSEAQDGTGNFVRTCTSTEDTFTMINKRRREKMVAIERFGDLAVAFTSALASRKLQAASQHTLQE